MFEKDRPDKNVKKLAEDHYVEAYANLNECVCSEEHRLHVALAETRARPIVFTPERVGIKGAGCATWGRRCK